MSSQDFIEAAPSEPALPISPRQPFNADDLHERLLRLVAMPELARGLGNAARSYVAGERMLAYQVAQRTAWYRSLWARRVELTNALHARMIAPPQLADGPAEP